MYESFSTLSGMGYGDNYGILPLAPLVKVAIRRKQAKKSAKIAKIDAELKALRKEGRKKMKEFKEKVDTTRRQFKEKIKQLQAKRRIAVIEMRNDLEQQGVDEAEAAASIESINNEEMIEDAADQQIMGDLALANEGEGEESFIEKYKWALLAGAVVAGYWYYTKR